MLYLLFEARIPNEEAIQKVRVSDPVRSGLGKGRDGLLDAVAAPLDEVTDDEVARAVEPVVTVDADQVVFAPVCLCCRPELLIVAHLIDEVDEPLYFGVGGGDLGYRRKFVVLDAVAEALRVVHGIGVADVDDILDLVAPEF